MKTDKMAQLHEIQKPTQREINIQSMPVSMQEIESIKITFQKRKQEAQEVSLVNSTKHLRKK